MQREAPQLLEALRWKARHRRAHLHLERRRLSGTLDAAGLLNEFEPNSRTGEMSFTLESPAFNESQKIPRKYSRGGDNISPPLVWKGAPAGTKSFVLVVEDPDAPAGTFRHWGLYNIPPERSTLPEAVTAGGKTETLAAGVNDFGEAHYDGPQPPKGHGVHHYHFRLAALDVDTLHLGPRARVEEIWAKARPHILGEAELIGAFENP